MGNVCRLRKGDCAVGNGLRAGKNDLRGGFALCSAPNGTFVCVSCIIKGNSKVVARRGNKLVTVDASPFAGRGQALCRTGKHVRASNDRLGEVPDP